MFEYKIIKVYSNKLFAIDEHVLILIGGNGPLALMAENEWTDCLSWLSSAQNLHGRFSLGEGVILSAEKGRLENSISYKVQIIVEEKTFLADALPRASESASS